MGDTPIGKITKQECEEIMALYNRSKGLKELGLTLGDAESLEYNADLCEEVTKENEGVREKMKAWWNSKAQKYRWEGEEWSVIFDTCEIFLEKS